MKKHHVYILVILLVIASCNNQHTKEIKENSLNDNKAIPITPPSVNNTILDKSQKLTCRLPKENSKVASDEPINNNPLSSLYKQLDKIPQIYTQSPNKDITINCTEGTLIKIRANSFITEETHQGIKGNIKIAVKEYYKLSDMLLARLSTNSDGNLLETAGMIHIAATANGEPCILKPTQQFEVSFPRNNNKEDMQLYLGDMRTDSLINWKLAGSPADQNKIYSIVDKRPEFPGGYWKLYQYFEKTIPYPISAQEARIQGTVSIGFIVNRSGFVENPMILKSLEPKCDQAALFSVKQIPRFIPGMLNGEAVNVYCRLPIRFTLNEESTVDEQYKKEFEKTYKDTSFINIPGYSINDYLFSSSNLGWINCDRLWNSNRSKVNYTVKISKNNPCVTSIIFHSIKGIIEGYQSDSSCSFYDVPDGEKITIVSIKYINQIPYLAIKESITSNQNETDFVFVPVTIELLKEEMKKLDSLF